jgi:hypothetical protein
MIDGLLQYHQQPYICKFLNLLARTQASCWFCLDKKVARNQTFGYALHNLASDAVSANATIPSPAANRTGLIPRWAPIHQQNHSLILRRCNTRHKTIISQQTFANDQILCHEGVWEYYYVDFFLFDYHRLGDKTVWTFHNPKQWFSVLLKWLVWCKPMWGNSRK